MEREMPAVRTVGSAEYEHSYGRLWHELESGGVLHVITKHNGRHRGWIVPVLSAGYSAERIGVAALAVSFGQRLDEVRDGKVFEIYDAVRKLVRGYLLFTAPDEIAALGWDSSLQYTRRTRSGALVFRDIYPIALTAEPVHRRRGVLASA